MRVLRLIEILSVALRFGLDEYLLGHERVRLARGPVKLLLFWRELKAPRAERLRLALENLGFIFVKFGQILCTRRDPVRHIREEAPYWGALIPQVPRLVHRVLSQEVAAGFQRELGELRSEQKFQSKLLRGAIALLAAILLWGIVSGN
jgi:ubiquinone biosynthesis protein